MDLTQLIAYNSSTLREVSIADERRVCKISDILWIQPLSFKNGSQTVHTFLKQIGDSVEYAITSLDEERARRAFGRAAAVS